MTIQVIKNDGGYIVMINEETYILLVDNEGMVLLPEDLDAETADLLLMLISFRQ